MQQTYKLPREKLERLGIRSGAISAWIEAVERSGQELHSFMLLRRCAVAAEGWWAPYGQETPHMAFSLSKSFTSTAVGLAVHEGLLTLDDRVIAYFPEKVNAAIERRYAGLTVRHLLTMSTGHAEDTKPAMLADPDGDWVRGFLETEPEAEPGSRFVYSSGASYMLSAIVQSVTGETLLDYLTPRLFVPLGIERPYWEACPKGRNAGGWGLRLKTEDIAKFGQLYLQGGRWEGEQLLPQTWVEEAASKQISNACGWSPDWSEGYGYQFWMCRHGAYRGDGAFGQFCIVLPEQEAVLAMSGGLVDMQLILDLVWEHLMPAFQEQALWNESEAATEQRERWHSLALNLPEPGLPGTDAGKGMPAYRYHLDDNRLGWTEVVVSCDGVDPAVSAVVQWKDSLGEHTIACGSSGWLHGKAPLDGEIRPAAAFGAWQEGGTFVMTLYRTDAPYKDTFTFRFSGDKAVIDLVRNVDFGPAPHVCG